MAHVQLENVGKRFGSVVAASGVDLEIPHGEFIVLVGPSGCGKSTTLRMVAGLEPLSEGTIKLDGLVVNDLPPKHRDIAMVFQSYALYPHMTVFNNMAFGLKMKGFDRGEIEVRVRDVASMLNISELLERKPRELSGGQRQRVAMGRALVRRPKVFLFDEPLSNLDAELRAQMRVEIKKLHKKLGATIIYVTHDQIEAMTLADRIVLMNQGRIVQIGDPMAIYESPNTKFVAGFIGTPKMNFIRGRLLNDSNGVLALHLAPGVTLPVPEQRRAAYAPYAGREMELGLRAEDLTVGEAKVSQEALIEAVVDVVEPTGAEALAFVTIEGSEIAARCRPDAVNLAGSRVCLVANMQRMHLIDPDSGQVVPVGP